MKIIIILLNNNLNIKNTNKKSEYYQVALLHSIKVNFTIIRMRLASLMTDMLMFPLPVPLETLALFLFFFSYFFHPYFI